MIAFANRNPPLTFDKLMYRAYRGVVRVVTIPARRLPEGPAKNRLRARVLRFQHSLPTELAVNPGDTVVQIGTPSPKTMLRFARVVGGQGRLVVVEAMPTNYERLQRAVERYQLRNVSLVQAAVCNENRMGRLAVSPFWGDHKIPLESVSVDLDHRPENSSMKEIPVKFARLDDVLHGLNVQAVDYLSVTVNGAEAEVIKGALETLKRSPKWARVYAKGHAIDQDGRPIHEQVDRILSAIGYRTLVTRGEKFAHHRRSGDIFAWKT